MSYDFRNRTYCSGSNTVPSAKERAEADGGDYRKFHCDACGRLVVLTRNLLVPTHLCKESAYKGRK